ncbi:hypothetical protein CNY89_28850, partial [Amaricoccus sp. HAR-UPW-R2A-40]
QALEADGMVARRAFPVVPPHVEYSLTPLGAEAARAGPRAGVSERMLAQTLQALEADGMVARRAFPVVPPHVEYSLTPLGAEAA